MHGSCAPLALLMALGGCTLGSGVDVQHGADARKPPPRDAGRGDACSSAICQESCRAWNHDDGQCQDGLCVCQDFFDASRRDTPPPDLWGSFDVRPRDAAHGDVGRHDGPAPVDGGAPADGARADAGPPDASGGVVTSLCGQGLVSYRGSCQPHAPSARGEAEVCDRFRAAVANRTTWVWHSNNSQTCDLGTYNDVAGQDATRLLNALRWLAGGAPVTHFAATRGDLECATMMRQNGLSHSPPDTWACYTAAGAAVAAAANLAGADSPLGQLAMYLDEGAQPYAFAHRRHLLGGSNNVSWSNTGGAGCNHLYYGAGGAGPRPWYSWPAAGHIPAATLVSSWHIAASEAWPSGVSVAVVDQAGGSPQAPTVEELGDQWTLTDGKYTIAFQPAGIATGHSYEVTVRASDQSVLLQYAFHVVACP